MITLVKLGYGGLVLGTFLPLPQVPKKTLNKSVLSKSLSYPVYFTSKRTAIENFN